MDRMRISSRLLAATLTPVLALSLTGCTNPIETIQKAVSAPSVSAGANQLKSATSAQIVSSSLVKANTLTVGLMSNASAPMVISSQDGNTVSGYNVDVAYALADKLGLGVEFVSVSSASAAGTSCDIVIGATASDSNNNVVGSYAQSATAFFGKKSAALSDSSSATSTPNTNSASSGSANTGAVTASISASSLNNKTIGVQDNSASQQILERSNLKVQKKTFSNLNEAFEALNNGSIDYVLCSATTGAYLMNSYADIAFLGTIDIPSSVGVGLGSSPVEVQEAVSSAMSDLVNTGVIDIIRGKWMNGLGTLSVASKVQGVTLGLGTSSDTETTTGEQANTSANQDGSSAGSNAVDING